MPLPLVERSPKEISRIIKETIESVDEVKGCRQVSVRVTGKRLDISAHVFLESSLRFEDVHRIVTSIERTVRNRVQRIARITVQTEPVGHGRTGIAVLVAEISEQVPGSRGVHNVHIQKIGGKWCVDLRLEVSANMTARQAHAIASEVEKKLKAADPNISEVTVHLESASDLIFSESQGRGTELRYYIEHVVKNFPEIQAVLGVKTRRNHERLNVVLRCRFDPHMSIKQAHDITRKLETTIRNAYPIVDELEVQEEPA